MSEKRFISKQAIMYYAVIAVVVVVFAASIFIKACITSFIYGNTWRKIGLKQIRPNIQILAVRGNIYSTNYELMAVSESRYRLFLDFCAKGIREDTLKKYIGNLADELYKMFPQKSAKQYKIHIMTGWKTRFKNNREYRLLDQDVNYIQWGKICQMPYFNQGRNKSGLYYKELVKRIKPYGTLASRTIGDVYGEIEKGGKSGLEKYYNNSLSGQAGIGTRRKVYGRYIDVTDVNPVVGQDIITTIDIIIQDIAEKALLNSLKKFNSESGTVVIMDVTTGEVKAIVNMGYVREGVWEEIQNYAVSDLVEPGSTFKIVSIMVAMEDGLIHPGDSVDTENGMVMIAGRLLKDHNAKHGGYGKVTVSQSIRYSSNIGVARLIEKVYGDKPGKYVDGIYRIGFHRDMDLEIPGYGIPRIRHPQDSNGGFWSRTTLPWMSFGYEIQIPPIYILSFFNAIANDGKLLKPMFVREIREGNKIVEKKHTRVINDRICSFSTLTAIRQMLDDVVNTPDGTGRPAHSDKIRIAGKTGTVQISQGAAGYRSAGLFYQVSFCGYFPAEKPQYSCIVVMRKPHKGIPSGGAMCGSVFKDIAEKMYARNLISNVRFLPIDTLHSLMPILKNGKKESSIQILKELKIPYEDRSEGRQGVVYDIERNNRIMLLDKKKSMIVPDVRGMGAKSAVFALESIGLRVSISGRGTVVAQSVPAGTYIIKGQVVELQLE